MCHKLVPIEGDLNEPGLGLGAADRARLVREAHIVLSVAASVDFNARLDIAVRTNILGVLELLQMGHEAGQLESFTHTSTCYVNTNQPEGSIEEAIYPGALDPEEELAQLLAMKLDELVRETPRLIRGFPNTYTYTKNLCERLLEKRRWAGFSLCVVRPSIISASMKEPFVGWLDSVVAIGAIYLTAGLGILSHLHCTPDKVGDLVPVDNVVDYTIVACAANAGSGQLQVHHAGSSHRNPIKWHQVMLQSQAYFTQASLEHRVFAWHVELIPSERVTRLKQAFRRAKYRLFEGAAGLVGSNKLKKDYSRLLKHISKAEMINEVFRFFMNNEWIFEQNHVADL